MGEMQKEFRETVFPKLERPGKSLRETKQRPIFGQVSGVQAFAKTKKVTFRDHIFGK